MEILGMRTVTITEKGQIAIPRELRKQKGFNEGAKIAIIAFKDRIELLPVARISSALASEKSLAKLWNSGKEDKAWKNL